MAGICVTLVASIILFYQMPTSSGNVKQVQSDWHLEKKSWAAKRLSPLQSKYVCEKWNKKRFWENLDPMLVARPPGSENIGIVAKHIYKLLGGTFLVQSDEFTAKPPYPHEITRFANIIATHNPSATRKLVLACHYDSKIEPKGFIGATDSAAPCAMMIEIAMMLKPYLNALAVRQNTSRAHDVTLQLLFLDGEEAFVAWQGNDNTYGARHLAQKWHEAPHAGRNVLDSIDLFVLLDLIGAPTTQFLNNQVTLTQWYMHAVNIESALRSYKLISQRSPYFHTQEVRHRVEDDHIPFQRRGVSILHLISIPFPRVWHTLGDDRSALHEPTMEEITKILAVFVAEYLDLNPLE